IDCDLCTGSRDCFESEYQSHCHSQSRRASNDRQHRFLHPIAHHSYPPRPQFVVIFYFPTAEPSIALPAGSINRQQMSALPPKADIERHDCHVCFVPKADKCTKRRARGCRESEPPNANDRLMGSVPRDKPSRRADFVAKAGDFSCKWGGLICWNGPHHAPFEGVGITDWC